MDETTGPTAAAEPSVTEPADRDAEVVDAEVLDDPVAPSGDGTGPCGEAVGEPTNPSADVTADDGTADDDAGPQSAVDDGTADAFDAVARERDEYLDALRQLQADFENFRKQALKRQGDAIEHATGRLVEELLPVLDACDAGIEHGDEGVIAIFTALLGVLEKVGLERLDPVDAPFDPNAHEAVLHEPAEDGEGDGPVVVEVMRPGYRWKERTLRAAMVKVKG